MSKAIGITFKEPTLDEHKAVSARWLSRIGPCLYENWPSKLCDLSFRSCLIEVTPEELEETFAIFDGGTPPAPLGDKIDAALLRDFPEGAFVKLSSRSPKDAFTDKFKCSSGSDVFSLFSTSERIIDDLVEYKYADHPCMLLVREWVNIPKHEEWRCFIENGEIIGITQYFYDETFAAIVGSQGDIKGAIVNFLMESVLPILHIQTVVVDVWMKESPQVIEINPYGLSDPCLLSYEDLGSATECLFRFNGKSAEIAA